MKLGVIGAGMIGGTVGKLWVDAGHEIRFGTRHPEELASLVKKLGPKAAAGSAAEAIAFGEAVLLAVPLKAVPALGRELSKALAGKVVLDACNAYEGRDGNDATVATNHPRGSSGWVAEQLPGAKVVKAFNTLYFKVLASEAHRAEPRLAIPLASDDRAALELASKLVREAGFEPIPLGALEKGRAVQPGSPVYNQPKTAAELRRALRLE